MIRRRFDAAGVRDLEASLPDVDDVRPAVSKVVEDQTDLVESFVDGFESRESYVVWLQECVTHTLGSLPSRWWEVVPFRPLDLSVVVEGDERRTWVERSGGERRPLPPEDRANVRRAAVVAELLPAFRSAVRSVRWDSVEYVSDDYDALDPDPDHQRHPAMRPALSDLHERQKWATETLIDGFRSLDELTRWGQRLTSATYAEVPADLVDRVVLDEPHSRDMLVTAGGDTPTKRFWRVSFAAAKLFPSFASAIPEVVQRSGELAEQERKEPEAKRM